MILAVASAALAAVQPVIPPDLTVVALQVPPVSAVGAPVAGDTSRPLAIPVVPVHVRVAAGGQQLFNDTLRVSASAGATYQESRSEAPEVVCSVERYYGSQQRYSLNINVYLRDQSAGPPLVNVSVSWQRPSAMASCGAEGTRQVQLMQTVPLGPGKTVTIQGDAGLSVTLSR